MGILRLSIVLCLSICVCFLLAPYLVDAYSCVLCISNGGDLQVVRILLNHASTDLQRESTQLLQEDAGRDSA